MKEYDKRIKLEMQKWMVELSQKYNVCLTFQFNKDGITESEARKAIKVAFGTLYRKILGRKWHNKLSEQYSFIGFQEMGKFGTNRHYHFMLKMEEMTFLNLYKLNYFLNKGVKKIVPSAKVKIDPMYTENWGEYIAKEITSDNNSLVTEKDFR